MGRLREFCRRWVYDPTHLPVEWTNHPHHVYKVLARFGCVCLGAVVPFGLTFILSGVPRDLDEGAIQLGWFFMSVVVVGFAVWLIAATTATASEQKSLVNYIYLGTIAPAHLNVLALIFQLYE